MRGVKFRNNDVDYHHCTETRLASTLGVVYQVFVLRLCLQSLSGLIPSLDAQQLAARTVSPFRCRSCITIHARATWLVLMKGRRWVSQERYQPKAFPKAQMA